MQTSSLLALKKIQLLVKRKKKIKSLVNDLIKMRREDNAIN